MADIQSDRILVLFVDDDDSFVELAVEYLERADDRLTVTPASDADEGLEILAEQDIDCIVADYKMEERTGIEFLDAVRCDYPDLPFIVYTGKGSEEIASTAIATGVTDYIRKGFDQNHYSLLANRIKNAVESYRARQAMHAQESTDVEAYYPPQETWFEASIYPDDNGISIYFRPIDERKQYEQTVSKLHEVANDLARMDSPFVFSYLTSHVRRTFHRSVALARRCCGPD